MPYTYVPTHGNLWLVTILVLAVLPPAVAALRARRWRISLLTLLIVVTLAAIAIAATKQTWQFGVIAVLRCWASWRRSELAVTLLSITVTLCVSRYAATRPESPDSGEPKKGLTTR
jgi:hypothetical protein